MKRMIRCSDMSSESRKWITSEEVDELLKGCSPNEKRLVAKLAQSSSPVEYLFGLTDTIELLDVDVSEEFQEILVQAIEKIH